MLVNSLVKRLNMTPYVVNVGDSQLKNILKKYGRWRKTLREIMQKIHLTNTDQKARLKIGIGISENYYSKK